MSEVKRSLDELHPVVRSKVAAVLADIKKAKLGFELFEAYRTPERQRQLFNQGGVTRADAWQSYHQYGMAVDIVLKENGKWSWDTSNGRLALWEQMNQIGRAHGLEPLSWEKPHLQLADTKLAELKAGRFPPGGDDSWAKAIIGSIERWPHGAPPAPIPSGERPRLPDSDLGEIVMERQSQSGRVRPEGSEKEAFERAQAVVKVYEGRYTNHPDDPGGPTNWGITHTTLARWRGVGSVTAAEVEAMSYDEAKDIYFANYWSRMKCGSLPGPLALAVYNIGVHAGTGVGARYLQDAVNAQGATIEADGDVGPVTLAAVNRFSLSETLERVLDLYEARLRAHPKFNVFGNGFMNRVAHLRQETSLWLSEWKAQPGVQRSVVQTPGTQQSTLQLPDTETKSIPVSKELTMPTEPQPNDLVAALLKMLEAANRQGSGVAASTTSVPAQAPASVGLEQIVAALKAIIDSKANKPVGLGPVNNALGEGIGTLLNGRKSAIGIIGSLVTYLVGSSAKDSSFTKIAEVVTGALPLLSGMSGPMLPIFIAMTVWGFLGKQEKYAGGGK